jgi:hypothetical protein
MAIATLRGMPYRTASSVVAPDQRLSARVLGLLVALALLCLLSLLGACGQRGALTLPEARPPAAPVTPPASIPVPTRAPPAASAPVSR